MDEIIIEVSFEVLEADFIQVVFPAEYAEWGQTFTRKIGAYNYLLELSFMYKVRFFVRETEAEKLSDSTLKKIFTNISLGVGKHGSYLMYVSKAVVRADGENLFLMREFLSALIEKYNLLSKEYLEG